MSFGKWHSEGTGGFVFLDLSTLDLSAKKVPNWNAFQWPLTILFSVAEVERVGGRGTVITDPDSFASPLLMVLAQGHVKSPSFGHLLGKYWLTEAAPPFHSPCPFLHIL